MNKVLITGICSFTGRHLVEHLRQEVEVEIFGCNLSGESEPPSGVHLEFCDMNDQKAVQRLIGSVRPDVIYHLAGTSNENNPAELIRSNVEGSFYVIDATNHLRGKQTKVLLIGSAAIYPDLREGLLSLEEGIPARPDTFFGLSRHMQLELGRIAHEIWGVPVYLCAPFNLVGPGLSDRFAPAALALRILRLSQRGEEILPIVNGDVVRDFVDVRDAVRAYHLIVENGRPGTLYNVCTGRGTSIRDLAYDLAEVLNVKINIVDEATRESSLRSSVHKSVGSFIRLQEDTGWRPRISLRQSLKDMVEAMNDL